MAGRNVFSVITPLGYRVIASRNRWREIVRFKHPALAGKEIEVEKCFKDPEFIRASTKDENVHLYYRKLETNYICAVTAVDSSTNSAFLVTTYLTTRVKQGDELWKK
jgi:hypothetical protein